MASGTDKNVTDNDKELDELLDSALEDLTKKPEANINSEENDVVPTDNAISDLNGTEWTEEFIKQAAVQFESNMASLLSQFPSNENADLSQEDINTSFKKMAEAAAQVISNPSQNTSAESDEFAAAISETLKGLSQGTEGLQNPFSEQDLANMFSNLGVEGDDSANGFLPFMQGMMQSLLSKDVLYPSLKEIINKYPAWLEDNKGKIKPEEFEQYTKQKELMEQVCNELETENESDTVEIKKQRFDKVLDLLQQMQNLGQPPADLVGDINAPGIQFDQQGNPLLHIPGLPNDPNQCCLM